jgi:hypothetical protein
VQFRKKLPTSMADVQSRYQAIPYGWREIDIAAVAARLIFDQKVTIKYAGNTIQPNNPKLPDMLRKKSEIGRTSISKRQVITLAKMKEAKDFLREYFDVMDVPADEDGLIAFIVERFIQQKAHYEALNHRYDSGAKYPDLDLVRKAISLVEDVLSQQKDNADYFETAAKGLDRKTAKALCNLFMGDVMALMNASGKTVAESALSPEALAALVRLAAAGTINGPTLKELLPEIFEKGGDPEAIVRERGLGAVSDTAALEAFVDEAIAANPGPVQDFKNGKKAAAGFFVGQVMKLSKGKADPKIVGGLVARKLAALSTGNG